MANFGKRPQPYRLQWPLARPDVEHIDEMLEILFKRISQTQQLAQTAATTADNAAAISAQLLMLGEDLGGRDEQMIPVASTPSPGIATTPFASVLLTSLFPPEQNDEPAFVPSADTAGFISTGLWTPTDASGAGLTFTNPAGSYLKMGPFVLVTGTVTYPATVDASNALIGGLPFTVLAGPNWPGGSFYNTLGVDAFVVMIQNTKTFAHYVVTTTAQYTNAGLTTKALSFWGFYRTY